MAALITGTHYRPRKLEEVKEMENRINNILNSMSAAHKMIQNLVIQATAGNASNIVNSLDSLQFAFNELQAIRDELAEKKENEKDG